MWYGGADIIQYDSNDMIVMVYCQWYEEEDVQECWCSEVGAVKASSIDEVVT